MSPSPPPLYINKRKKKKAASALLLKSNQDTHQLVTTHAGATLIPTQTIGPAQNNPRSFNTSCLHTDITETRVALMIGGQGDGGTGYGSRGPGKKKKRNMNFFFSTRTSLLVFSHFPPPPPSFFFFYVVVVSVT